MCDGGERERERGRKRDGVVYTCKRGREVRDRDIGKKESG